jgi:acyl-CoA thioesterase-1
MLSRVTCVLLPAAIAGCERQPGAPSAADPDSVRRVVVLGDSLAVSPSQTVHFPAELQALIAERGLRWTVTNAGLASDTTAGGLRRVEGLLADDVGVLILALGAHDGLSGVPVDTIARNLSRIIELAASRHIQVLLCRMETPLTHGWDYSVAFHQVFPRLAQRHALPLVPFSARRCCPRAGHERSRPRASERRWRTAHRAGCLASP